DDGKSWEKVLYKIRHHVLHCHMFLHTFLFLREKATVRPKKVSRRYKEENEEIAVSIRWLAEVVW
ncbi:hypothetical protein HID58_075596, partial [Brassica napus]